MSDFIGWIQLAGKSVLVEPVREERRFRIVRLCAAWGGFARGHELRVPRASFEPCAPRPRDNRVGPWTTTLGRGLGEAAPDPCQASSDGTTPTDGGGFGSLLLHLVAEVVGSLGALLGRARLQEDVVRLTRDARRHCDRRARPASTTRHDDPQHVLAVEAPGVEAQADPDSSLTEHAPVRANGLRRQRRIPPDTGKFALHVEPVNLLGVGRGAVASYAPEANVQTDGDIPRVEVDAQPIEQVLLNLLGNAARHGTAALNLVAMMSPLPSRPLIRAVDRSTTHREVLRAALELESGW